jgi:hypothetical protein
MDTTVTPRDIDRSGWGAGSWDEEPDRVDFEHAGFPCLILRTRMGFLCGYVAVPEGHPDFEKTYDDIGVDVHGGLTYAAHCSGHICHVPAPGAPDNVWWLGFDCAHCWDIAPGRVADDKRYGLHDPMSQYRDIRYVRREVESLADQLHQRALVSGDLSLTVDTDEVLGRR